MTGKRLEPNFVAAAARRDAASATSAPPCFIRAMLATIDWGLALALYSPWCWQVLKVRKGLADPQCLPVPPFGPIYSVRAVLVDDIDTYYPIKEAL